MILMKFSFVPQTFFRIFFFSGSTNARKRTRFLQLKSREIVRYDTSAMKVFLTSDVITLVKIVYFDTRGQNGRLAHCKCTNTAFLHEQ